MSHRRSMLPLVASLGLVIGIVAGCNREAALPTEATVRLAVIPGAHHGGRPFATDMTQEVTTVPEHEGDPDGTGTALITLNHGQREVCWDLSVAGITLPATASHIHQAAPSIRGPIIVVLSAPDETGQASGCQDGVDRALIEAIVKQPERFYVNVHTTDFPPGAVRGQLAK